jgi:hypothetical protein
MSLRLSCCRRLANVALGSFGSVSLLRRHFRFHPVSDQIACIAPRQQSANTRHRKDLGNRYILTHPRW